MILPTVPPVPLACNATVRAVYRSPAIVPGTPNVIGPSEKSCEITQVVATPFRVYVTVIVRAADTVAECGGFILGKPRDEIDAREMLQQLSGREHRVYTGVCLWRVGGPAARTRVAMTRLRMDLLSAAEIESYLATGQWEGKAGAFGYQDRLGWVHVIEGSESNVVGLPMELLAEMLAEV